jgi:type IV pilus assembly protein PilC
MTATQEVSVAEAPTNEQRELAPESGLRRLLNIEITKRKIPKKDLMHFSRQLAVFIRAGIPIVDALDTIREEMSPKQLFTRVLDDVSEQLRSGATFSGAAASHGEVFPAYYLGILESAELTGRLDDVLDQLADYIDRDLEARRKVVTALTYPGIIAGLAVIVVGILVGFVLPRFETFFDDLNAKLPLPTRIMLGISHITSTYWWVFALLFAAFVALMFWFMRAARGRVARDKLLLRLPIVGDLIQHAILERFCRIMSSMMSAGVSLPDAMSVTSDAVNNAVYREGLDSAREAMMRGEGLAAPLAETGLFPAAARQMFRVGEDTGTLDKQLDTAATYFDRELDYKIKRFTNLFEPVVIVAMGVIVGFVAIALVSAMYGIFNQVKT